MSCQCNQPNWGRVYAVKSSNQQYHVTAPQQSVISSQQPQVVAAASVATQQLMEQQQPLPIAVQITTTVGNRVLATGQTYQFTGTMTPIVGGVSPGNALGTAGAGSVSIPFTSGA